MSAPSGRSSGRRAGWPAKAALVAVLAVTATTLSACGGGSSASLSSRVSQWASANGFGSTVGTLLGDGSRVVRVVRLAQGSGSLKASCGVLETDSAKADSLLPTPDTQLTAALNGAITGDATAADLCYSAAPTDTAALDRAVADITRADALLESAVQQVSGLTGHVPSTTTTTIPGGAGGDPFGFGG